MRTSRRLLILASTLVAACDEGAGTGGSAATANGTSSQTNGTSNSVATSSTGLGGGDPEDLVPPEPLGGDPATACPPAFQVTPPAPGQNDGFEVAGQSRNFVLFSPAASFQGPRPLLVALNGTGESGASFSDRAHIADFTEHGFHVLAPSSNGNGSLWPVWDALHAPGEPDVDNPDLAYFDALVACAGAHLAIDKNRIYVTGHSAGGIMTNYLLQRRSELLAGGIIASGGLSFTAPDPKLPIDEMFVLVTWGGDNDTYSGSAGNTFVSMVNFVEQASLSSQFYEAEANTSQANCKGDEVGHAWLLPLNDWFATTLLEHPKGLARKGSLTLPPVPSNGAATCTTAPFVYESPIQITCGASTTAGCQASCQLFGDCLVENGTVGPVLAEQLLALGFSGTVEAPECGGCTSRCEDLATSSADAEVMTCMQNAQASATCAPGGEGAVPAFQALDTCCEGRDDSAWCVDTCTIFLGNAALAPLLTSCPAIVD